VKVTARRQSTSRCDALFKKETTHIDVQRTVTTYTSRLVENVLYDLGYHIGFIDYAIYCLFRSEALKSLQGAGGAYCLVTAGKDHATIGGPLRGFSEGDNIRVIRPKVNTKRQTIDSRKIGDDVQVPLEGNGGYGLKFTWDVPVGKAIGVLTVRACWHDIVFRNEFGFTEAMFLY
jgi:hypothetical protein